MNQYQQVKLNGLETFVSNLNNLYIELLIEDAVRTQKKAQVMQKIDEALAAYDAEAFYAYHAELEQLEALQ